MKHRTGSPRLQQFTVEGVTHAPWSRYRCSCGATGLRGRPGRPDVDEWRAHVRDVVECYLARLSARDRGHVATRHVTPAHV